MNDTGYFWFDDLKNYVSTFLTPQRLERMLQIIQRRTNYISIVLENIFQPHNASAVLRTCECFGISQVHIIENTNTYRVNPDVVLGAAQWLDIFRWKSEQSNTIRCIEYLKSHGYQIVATVVRPDATSLYDFRVHQKTAFLIGTEKDGLTAEACVHADTFLHIPIYGFTESFNLSVTAAIIISWVHRQLVCSDISWQLSREEQQHLFMRWIIRNVNNGYELLKKFFQQSGHDFSLVEKLQEFEKMLIR